MFSYKDNKEIFKKFLQLSLLLSCFWTICGEVAVDDGCNHVKLSACHAQKIQSALPDAWPWMTAIFNVTNFEYLFSGALISKEHVITGEFNPE